MHAEFDVLLYNSHDNYYTSTIVVFQNQNQGECKAGSMHARVTGCCVHEYDYSLCTCIHAHFYG